MGKRGGAGEYTSDDYRALTMELLDMRQDTYQILAPYSCSWINGFMHVRIKEIGTHWHPPYTNRVFDKYFSLQPFSSLKEGEFGHAADARPLCVCVHRTVKSLK